MIVARGLTKSFGKKKEIHAVRDVSLDAADGQITGLLGPNGAGKTTLLRMMAGLDDVDSGAILKPAALTVGYLPQDGLTHEGRTLFEEAASAFGNLLAIKARIRFHYNTR